MARRPKNPIRAVCFAAAILAFAACTSATGDDQAVDTTTTSTTTTTTTTTTQVPVTTLIEAPAPEFRSPGEIMIGDRTFLFVFECYAAGAGDVLALGLGTDAETGEDTEAIVQAFLGSSYVAILIGDEQVLELAIDRPAELFVQGDLIRGSALRFVDADGASGVGESLGLGTVNIDCEGFAPGLPEGYETS